MVTNAEMTVTQNTNIQFSEKISVILPHIYKFYKTDTYLWSAITLLKCREKKNESQTITRSRVNFRKQF